MTKKAGKYITQVLGYVCRKMSKWSLGQLILCYTICTLVTEYFNLLLIHLSFHLFIQSLCYLYCTCLFSAYMCVSAYPMLFCFLKNIFTSLIDGECLKPYKIWRTYYSWNWGLLNLSYEWGYLCWSAHPSCTSKGATLVAEKRLFRLELAELVDWSTSDATSLSF